MRLGIDLGGTKISGVVLGPCGEERARLRVAAPQGVYADTLSAIATLVERLERMAGSACSIGVGIPGAISPATGLVKNANSTWLIGHPLDRDLADRLGRPVRVQNDANCLAVSEATDGSAAGAEIAFAVILGTGVGAGIAIGGYPLTGANAIAGEWGHNPLPWAEEEDHASACYCGQRGCLETYLSGPALAADFAAANPDAPPMAAAEIAQDAARGDSAARAALARHASRLARGLAHVINILDPHVIVLGGGLSRMPHLYAEVPRLWGRWIFSDTVATRLVPAHHGDDSGVRGAARLWPESEESGDV